jgi:hypothetical protein
MSQQHMFPDPASEQVLLLTSLPCGESQIPPSTRTAHPCLFHSGPGASENDPATVDVVPAGLSNHGWSRSRTQDWFSISSILRPDELEPGIHGQIGKTNDGADRCPRNTQRPRGSWSRRLNGVFVNAICNVPPVPSSCGGPSSLRGFDAEAKTAVGLKTAANYQRLKERSPRRLS